MKWKWRHANYIQQSYKYKPLLATKTAPICGLRGSGRLVLSHTHYPQQRITASGLKPKPKLQEARSSRLETGDRRTTNNEQPYAV
jgi:hypothetical protein